MKLAIGSDHAGYPLKAHLVEFLRARGHEVLDMGTDSAERSVDFSDYAGAVAEKVAAGEVERGIVICGSGVGASIAANKVPGAYAATCHDTYSAHQGVEHDNMNVLSLGGRIIGTALAEELVTAFLGAEFQAHEERLIRRYNKVKAIEATYSKQA